MNSNIIKGNTGITGDDTPNLVNAVMLSYSKLLEPLWHLSQAIKKISVSWSFIKKIHVTKWPCKGQDVQSHSLDY